MGSVDIASSTTTAAVIEGSIMSPLVGAWTADLRIDQIGASNFPAGTKVTITSQNGYSRTGIVDPTRTGSRYDAVHVRVIGGAGGLTKPASARSYVQPGAFVRDVVNGLMADAGETLDSTASSAFMGTNLAAWSVLGGNAVARNLKALIKIVAPSYNWRILANGNLWIGPETWPAASGQFEILDFDPADGSTTIGAESPFVVPGQSVAGVGNVSRVLDVIEGGRFRTQCWWDIPGAPRGVVDATQRMAILALPGVDYYAMYVCQVQSQSGDLTTVDVAPVGARNKAMLGGLQRVPVRFGTGIGIQVAQGATVLLGWDGGNPAAPFVMAGLSGDTAMKINLGGNTHPLPLFDTFFTDLAVWIGAVNTLIATLVPGTGVTGNAAYASAIILPTSLAVKMATPTLYQSNIVSNG